ncbi:MAG: TadA family conjugal transfer-associated ATPase, partial [Nocardioidaceae bacterium]|nr:TadA family conjugal transfer-associated ATPase [Nocardioidaceae bacterium]
MSTLPSGGSLVSGGMLDEVRDRLARDGAALTPDRVATALRDQGRPVGDATVLAVHDALRRDVSGAGPLESLLRTPGVTDVLVNGPGAV